ncbi:Peptidyl-prolyl cis-trans isomerase cyp6 [Dinochytrium kinnereticum]|nr:Peptidyl-prolyl cis-trans isomerase cyp6 [Dinochytrium kinnereticum]
MRIGLVALLGALAVSVAAKPVKVGSSILDSPAGTLIPDQYIVVFKKHVSESDIASHENFLMSLVAPQPLVVQSDLENQMQLTSISMKSPVPDFDIFRRYMMSEFKGYAAKMPKKLAEALARLPEVDFIEQDHVVRVLDTQPNPPSWGLKRISSRDLPLPTGYTFPASAGEGVDAYIVDTGVFTKHKDFQGRAVIGKSFSTDKNDNDGNGHGTHVAGTVAGSTFGVAKKANIIAVKVLNSQGSGTNSDVIAGIEYAGTATKKSGRKSVGNMSLGGSASAALDAAVRAAIENGVMFAVAAGNSAGDACKLSPARVKEALTVAASDKFDKLASFSERGRCVDIIAPGVDITSSWNNGKENTISGTSMATPHACGVLALAAAEHNFTSPKELKQYVIAMGSRSKISGVPKDTVNIFLYANVTGPVPDPLPEEPDKPEPEPETSLGDIVIDLYVKKAPRACLNFLKLCKLKYYNFSLFHTITKNFTAQVGGDFKVISGEERRFFPPEIHPKLKHNKKGIVSFATISVASSSEGSSEDVEINAGMALAASQFFFTLVDEPLDYLDGKHAVFGHVVEGLEVLDALNLQHTDDEGRPFRDLRIKHTCILDDPFPDPSGMVVPSRSPSPTEEMLKSTRIGEDEELFPDVDPEVLEKESRIKEAAARALTLEMIGDLPFAEIKPPENILFVCKLNPITRDEDLELIFSRFGEIMSKKEEAEEAYFKMDNVLIDDRRIHVDFSQSVSKLHKEFMMGRRRKLEDGEFGAKGLQKRKQYRDGERQDDGFELVFDHAGDLDREKKRQKASVSSDEDGGKDEPLRGKDVASDQRYHDGRAEGSDRDRRAEPRGSDREQRKESRGSDRDGRSRDDGRTGRGRYDRDRRDEYDRDRRRGDDRDRDSYRRDDRRSNRR